MNFNLICSSRKEIHSSHAESAENLSGGIQAWNVDKGLHIVQAAGCFRGGDQ